MTSEFLKYLDKSMKYLHRQGAFLTVKDRDGRVNVMTMSWGNIGFEWGRPIFTVLVRKSRYTSELIANAEEFTVSIPTTSDGREFLAYTGSRSGRDVDKFSEGKITKVDGKTIDVPVVGEGDIIYECRIVYKHKIDKDILHDDIKLTSYMDGDYHTIYYGEILSCYTMEK